jgi:hypothetical protein
MESIDGGEAFCSIQTSELKKTDLDRDIFKRDEVATGHRV